MRAIGFDTETYLITDTDKAPKVVCCTWFDGQRSFITRPDDPQSYAMWTDRDAVFLGVNLAYDLVALMRWHPLLIPHIIRALDEGRIIDVSIRDRLLHLSQHGTPGYNPKPSLADLALKYLKLDLSKWKEGDDIWRLKYGTLDSLPFNEWPKEALEYALDDAKHPWHIFQAQGGFDNPQATETLQNQAAVVLHAIGTYGFSINQETRRKIQAALLTEKAALDKTLAEKGIDWIGKGSQARMAQAMIAGWHRKHRGMLEAHATGTGVQMDVAFWEQWIPQTENIKRMLERCAEKGEAPPGLSVPHQFDWTAWCQEVAKTLPEIPHTTRGPSTSAETLELIADCLPGGAEYLESKHKQKMLSTYIDPYGTETVHPRFNVMVSTGRTGCSDPNCFSLDTELLTDRGWISFFMLAVEPTLRDYVRVMQWDKGEASLTEPLGWVFHESKPCIRLFNDHIDLLCTEEHRCLYRDRKNGALRVVEAASYPYDAHQLHAGVFNGGTGLELSDIEIRFCVAFQADGSVHDGGVDFGFKKKRKYDRLISILKEGGWRYSEHSPGDKSRMRLRVLKQPIVEKALSFLGSGRKQYDWRWLGMNRKQMDVFLTEIPHWDGLYGHFHYYSSIKINSDVVQALTVLSGRRANQRIYRTHPEANPNYQLDITDRDYSLTTNIGRDKVASVSVGCVSVPSGFVFVRRNGKVMVTGQCQNIPRKDKARPSEAFRTMFQARPGRVLGTVDYSQLELCTLSATIRHFLPEVPCKMGEAIDKDMDVHCITGGSISGRSYEAMLAGKKTDPSIIDARQAAKACIGHNSPVLVLEDGCVWWCPIQDVKTSMKVWDGLEWVSHEGLLHQGVRTTMRIGSATLTPDHMVYENEEIAVSAGACHQANALAFGKEMHWDTSRRAVNPDCEKTYGPSIQGMDGLVPVYDLKNAGPRHRFLCGGLIVSNCNFGLPGGLGANAFVSYAKSQYGVIVNHKDAWRMINGWKQTWPEVGIYLKWNGSIVEHSPGGRGTGHTVTGRPKANCFYTEINNYRFQGLAADGAKASLWGVWRECVLGWFWSKYAGLSAGYGFELGDSPLRDSRLVNFVHDEIVAEHPQGDQGKAALKRQEEIMVERMHTTCRKLITIRVEGKLSDQWEH